MQKEANSGDKLNELLLCMFSYPGVVTHTKEGFQTTISASASIPDIE